MLVSSQWYTRSEQAIRFSYWYCGMGIGQIFGGLLSWAFQHVSPTAPLAGWRIMFLVIGLFTVLLGIAIVFAVPDTPMKAWFLTDEEKVNLLEHVKTNQTGIENHTFQPYQLKEGVLDFQLWCMFLIVMFVSQSKHHVLRNCNQADESTARHWWRCGDDLLCITAQILWLLFAALCSAQHAQRSLQHPLHSVLWYYVSLLWSTLRVDHRCHLPGNYGCRAAIVDAN